MRNEETTRRAEARSSVVQYHLPVPNRIGGSDETLLGIEAYLTQPDLQSDAFKELVNKFAWALGSTYRYPYNNRRSIARVAACQLAQDVIAKHGYPRALAK